MYVVIADIPGVPKDRVSVQVKDNKIMIEGKRKKKVVSDEDVYLIAGRRNGFFKKMIEMPIDADSQQMAAKIEDGMLILTIPRVKTVNGATYVSIHYSGLFQQTHRKIDSGNGLLLLGQLVSHRLQSGLLLLLLSLESLVFLQLSERKRHSPQSPRPFPSSFASEVSSYHLPIIDSLIASTFLSGHCLFK